ncbi:NAD+ transporter [Penicillium cinerascens]|uniref:NAD+ transporter n=1 Tax=Penicillium cinerascens TaxID=70096 RepID=A0A9W9N8T5_9EURO|nr:NAD+ transporter [Penicillium cinerascens]KAJ5215339.1 NAD+ transporter [Penicillium cinerascens]
MYSDDRDISTATSNFSHQPPGFHSENGAQYAPHVPAADVSPSADFITRLEVLSAKVANIWIALFCGAFAGVASGIVTCPLNVIKTKLQAQGGFARRAAQLDAARKMYRIEGLRSFYSGLTPALLGLRHVAIQFPLYEYLRMAFTGYSIGGAFKQRQFPLVWDFMRHVP